MSPPPAVALNLASPPPRREAHWWQTDVMAGGSLRIYLGASPGVGTTFAMLDQRLRRTLDPTRPVHFITDPGMGYRFEVNT